MSFLLRAAAAAGVGYLSWAAWHALARARREPGKRPFLVALDGLLAPFMFFRVGWFKHDYVQVDSILALARRSIGDKGSEGDGDTYIKRYKVALAAEAQLGARHSPAGLIYANFTLMMRFRSKMAMRGYIQRHPSILQVPVSRPVFVVGFPRTGTTLLSRLLQQHTSLRAHYTWEQFEPVPWTEDEDATAQKTDHARRHAAVVPRMNMALRNVFPEKLQAIHEIGPDEPEECTLPMAMSLPWDTPVIPNMVAQGPAYKAHGARDAYEEYKTFLQLLSWQVNDRDGTGRRWLLKSPFHISFIEDLVEVFPDATLVWTHRDPAECVVSTCSLFHEMRTVFYDDDSIDRAALGRCAQDFCASELAHMQRMLKEKNIRHLNVHYKDLVADPKATAKEVWNFAGLSGDEENEALLDEWLEENARRRKTMKKGSKTLHAYTAQDYGLTAGGIREATAEYIAEQGVQLNDKL